MSELENVQLVKSDHLSHFSPCQGGSGKMSSFWQMTFDSVSARFRLNLRNLFEDVYQSLNQPSFSLFPLVTDTQIHLVLPSPRSFQQSNPKDVCFHSRHTSKWCRHDLHIIGEDLNSPTTCAITVENLKWKIAPLFFFRCLLCKR